MIIGFAPKIKRLPQKTVEGSSGDFGEKFNFSKSPQIVYESIRHSASNGDSESEIICYCLFRAAVNHNKQLIAIYYC